MPGSVSGRAGGSPCSLSAVFGRGFCFSSLFHACCRRFLDTEVLSPTLSQIQASLGGRVSAERAEARAAPSPRSPHGLCQQSSCSSRGRRANSSSCRESGWQGCQHSLRRAIWPHSAGLSTTTTKAGQSIQAGKRPALCGGTRPVPAAVPCARATFEVSRFHWSPSVGLDVKTRCGKKKLVIEFGGNAACVLDSLAGSSDAGINAVVKHLVFWILLPARPVVHPLAMPLHPQIPLRQGCPKGRRGSQNLRKGQPIAE